MFLQIFAISAILLYILWFCFENFRRNVGKPPGPIQIPPFGNLVQIFIEHKNGHVALQKLAKKYGDIMSIKLGLLDTVVFSSYDAAKQVFTKEEAAGRNCTGFLWDRNLRQTDIGLTLSEGAPNDETRRFCRDTLKKYGYGNREFMRNMVLDELTELMKFMENESNSNPENKVHFGSDFFHGTYLNITSTWMIGKRFNYDDPVYQNLLAAEHEFAKNGVIGVGIMTAYPFLRHIFPKALGYDVQIRGIRGFQDIGLRLLRERKKGDYRNEPSCFTDDFLQKMDKNSLKSNQLYTEAHYVVLFADLLQGGTDTASNVINFILLHLVANERIQEKVYQEISTVIGSFRLPQIGDKLQMKYTHAVILEGLRWSRVLVMGGPRKAIKDFSYRGYVFKKNTVLMFNTQSIFFDEETWGDPQVFRPERFIDLQGNIDSKKQEIVSVAFGTGKRMCFGEGFARDSLFIFITTLIQKFKFRLPPGAKPNLEPRVGISLFADPYDAIVTLREK